MYYDMHTHSQFSTDSHMTMETALESALDKNLSGIAFTDHLDIDFTNREDEYQFDVSAYFTYINKIIDSYSGKIDILKAVEFGIQEHVIEETKARIAGFDYDFILGSTHLYHRLDPYEPEFYANNRPKVEMYTDCLACIYKNIQLYNDFDVLAHIDYHVRKAPYSDPAFYYSECADITDEILKFIVDKGIGFEINTSTYKVAALDTMLLKRYHELGGEIVTIGSDAHYAGNVAQLFPKYLEIIKNCGFDYVAHYKARKPVFDKIDI